MSRRLAFALLLLSALASQRCGYRLAGHGNAIAPDAATIAVPAFVNQTSRQQVEQFATFAVREEFVRRSRLRLVDDQRLADLLLEGTVTSFTTAPLSYSPAGAANLYEVRLTLDVRLVDLRRNEVTYQGQGLAFRDTYDTDSGDFFSQETGSLDRIAAKLAASIVATILESF